MTATFARKCITYGKWSGPHAVSLRKVPDYVATPFIA
jgi:hypothetical protein